MTTTLNNIFDLIIKVADILIVWIVMYYVLKIVRNNKRTIQIFKGVLFIVFVYIFARAVGLTTVEAIAQQVVGWGIIVIIIIFQPEIRGMLEKMGKVNVFSGTDLLTGHEKEQLVDILVSASMQLSATKTGALITLEQGQSLSDYINTGTPIDSKVTAELLTALFVTTTPLHDGAVIIRRDKIACASAYFPPTNVELPSKYGARHRAAIGISEISDSITIVISEETGTISIAQSGALTVYDEVSLREFLLRALGQTETEVSRTVGIGGRRFKLPTEKKNLVPVDQEIKETVELKEGEASIESGVKKVLGLFKKKQKAVKETEPVEETKTYAEKKEKAAGEAKVETAPSEEEPVVEKPKRIVRRKLKPKEEDIVEVKEIEKANEPTKLEDNVETKEMIEKVTTSKAKKPIVSEDINEEESVEEIIKPKTRKSRVKEKEDELSLERMFSVIDEEEKRDESEGDNDGE